MVKTKFIIDPPLLNSASPWATTLEDIQALYNSPYTGAVTTRTSLLEGFTHDPATHQHVFFNAGSSAPKSSSTSTTDTDPSASNLNADADPTSKGTSSLNTYGYSPLTLSEYLGIINEIIGQRHLGTSHTQIQQQQQTTSSAPPTRGPKPFILSVTGTPDELAMAYALLTNAAEMDEALRLAMELNLSCPNIANTPPPAYDPASLTEYLTALADSKATYRGRMSDESVPRLGLKLPPYTHHAQFEMVVSCLRAVRSSEPGEGSVVDFVTCTNTLGSSLVLDPETLEPTLNSEAGTGLGGLAGAALHPLALGNVATLRKMLDQYEETKDIVIIGVGGVEDKAGSDRMRKVGAEAVACATALGRHGVEIFEKITKG